MKQTPRTGIGMGDMGDIDIGEIGRFFKVKSLKNRQHTGYWVSV